MRNYADGIDEFRSQVRSLDGKWDVVDMERGDANRACERRFRIDPEWRAGHLEETGQRLERWIQRPVMVPKDRPAGRHRRCRRR
jgi:hypothetical protein